MLALKKVFEQIDLFPEATKQDIQHAKSLLTGYRRMRMLVEDFERQSACEMNTKQRAVYLKFKATSQLIERAVNLILDDEIRRIMEFRFLKGQRHKNTVIIFRSIMSDRTVDRKIEKGIESVANTLKVIEE